MSNSLGPHGLQLASLLCSPLPLGVCSNSCPSLFNQWCYFTISFSADPFSSFLQSFPASRSFPRSCLFASGGQSIGAKVLEKEMDWKLVLLFCSFLQMDSGPHQIINLDCFHVDAKTTWSSFPVLNTYGIEPTQSSLNSIVLKTNSYNLLSNYYV